MYRERERDCCETSLSSIYRTPKLVLKNLLAPRNISLSFRIINGFKMQFSTIVTLACAVTSATAIDVYFTCPAEYTGRCCLFQSCSSAPSQYFVLDDFADNLLGHDATKPTNATHKHEWACLNNVDFTANCCDPEVSGACLSKMEAWLMKNSRLSLGKRGIVLLPRLCRAHEMVEVS